MITWAITFSDGSKGFQVMDDKLDNSYVTDELGNVLEGIFEYKVDDNA